METIYVIALEYADFRNFLVQLRISWCSMKELYQMAYLSIPEFYELFPNEEASREYIAERRWVGEPVCPRCGSTKIWEIKGGMHYKCGDCPNSKAKFSVRTGTVLETPAYRCSNGTGY